MKASSLSGLWAMLISRTKEDEAEAVSGEDVDALKTWSLSCGARSLFSYK
jgi:hypothetical protein